MRSRWWRAVVTSRAPVAPTGWPRAMAPPPGFTRSMSGCSSRSQASTTEANASLISTTSMSPSDRADRSRMRWVASIGPVSMRTGSTPTRHWWVIRARGRRPRAAALAGEASSTAAAPSEICDDVPAVWIPSSRATGFRLASLSSEVSLGPSSAATVCVEPVGLPSSSTSGASIPTISGSNHPSSRLRRARSCEVRPKRSASARVTPHLSAILSAPSNCDANS